VRLALALDDPGLAPTRLAFAAGRVDEEQARVIVAAVGDLPPGEVTPEDGTRAQEHLIGLADHHDARALRVLGRRVLEVLAPESADAQEGRLLEAEEARARARCGFSMRDDGAGTSTGWFRLPTLQAEMLGKAVQAFAAPRRAALGSHVDGDGEGVPHRVLLGQAFAELVEHLPTEGLPQAGGVAATIVVTMPLDRLTAGIGAAVLDTGGRISAGEVRRLACGAGIVPAVLGTGSVPLDLGRTARFHTAGQRTAMAIRDGGCTAEGCHRPPAWCEAHHDQAWSEGGPTSLDRGRLLCPRHHHLAHHPGYDLRHLPNGRVRFTRRT
jgi:hypothetical protein